MVVSQSHAEYVTAASPPVRWRMPLVRDGGHDLRSNLWLVLWINIWKLNWSEKSKTSMEACTSRCGDAWTSLSRFLSAYWCDLGLDAPWKTALGRHSFPLGLHFCIQIDMELISKIKNELWRHQGLFKVIKIISLSVDGKAFGPRKLQSIDCALRCGSVSVKTIAPWRKFSLPLASGREMNLRA